MSCNGALAATLGFAALTLHGCGGGGEPSASTTSTTSTTTTVDPCAGVPPEPAGTGPYADLIDDLNHRFKGFDAEDPSSPVGLTIRMLAGDEDASFFCGTPCHDGFPDCRVSASLYNNKMMISEDSKLVMTMGRSVGIVYNQTSIESRMGKCSYMYDGATFGRVNHGCGCAAKHKDCGTPDSPYNNQDCEIVDGGYKNCKNNTNKSPDVETCWCYSQSLDPATPKPADATTTDQQCFFSGPALYPPAGMLENELHKMVKERLYNQANPPTEELPGTNGTIRRKVEYWNEVVVEGEELRNLLEANPRDAYAAFVYIKGSGPVAQTQALQLQQDTFQTYGGELVPVLEIDTAVDVRCTAPFLEASDMPTVTTTTSWDGKTCQDQQYGQCGGRTWAGPKKCCNDWVCEKQSEEYSQCQPKTGFETVV